MSDVYAELAELGVATVFEASGRRGLIDADLERIVPGTRAAGPARTVRCGDGDNLMVHAAIEHAQAGEVLVLTMNGAEARDADGRDLIATQAKAGVSRRCSSMLPFETSTSCASSGSGSGRDTSARADPTRTWWASSTSRSLGLTFASTACG